MPPAELDTAKQEQAKEYAHLNRKLMLVDLALGAGYVILWPLTGLSVWWREQITALTANPWIAIALFGLGFSFIYTLLSAPLSYYTDFVLPHRYALSRQSLGAWMLDQIKSMALSGLLGLAVLEVVYWLLRVAPATWWLWAALFMLGFTVVLGNLSPVLIAPLFYKFSPLEDEDLKNRLLALAQRAGARVEGVFTFDMSRKTVQANAALMGLGNTRRIVLGDTLLSSFSADEIETVLAHELGHHVHRDILWGIGVQSLLTLGGFWLAGQAMAWGSARLGYAGVADPAGLPLFLLAMGLFGLVTMPLSNMWSRSRERMADAYALEATGKPQAFAEAMTRLANQNLSDAEPPAWVEFLLHSHPSISKRVAMARQFATAKLKQ